MTFRAYVDHGWKLCRIKPGEKGPRYFKWNHPGHEIPAEQAEHLTCAGLMHAYSGTCAIDIDSLDLARPLFAEHGIDLDALLAAPDSVQIDSGRPGRAKLLYALPEPLYTVQITDAQKVMVFELRCKSRTERTTQDVIPPSIHPKTKKPYQWKYGDPLTGDWRALPPLPTSVREMWLKLSGPQERAAPAEKVPAVTSSNPALRAECEQILAEHSADCDYDTWIKLGMMLEHELGAEGFDLWNQWSASSDKYPGEAGLDSHWNSFGNSPNPVTIGTFRKTRVATREMFDEITDDELDDDPFKQATVEEQATKYIFTPINEIAKRPPPVWLVHELVPREELVMMYGPSGAGKSFVALDMALAIARGVEWWGRSVKPGNVLWLAAEAEGSLRNRYRAYTQANDIAIDDVTNFYVLGAGFNFGDTEEIKQLAEAAKPLEPVLCVLDTLAASTGGLDENSGQDISKVLDSCRAIHRATGATILLVHHSGKDTSKGARGHSSIKAAVHAELNVDYDIENDKRTFTVTKQRDGESGEPWSFSLEQVTVGIDDDDKPIVSAHVKFGGVVKPTVKGDGGARPPPSGDLQQLTWRIAQATIGLAKKIETQELVGAVVNEMSPPPSGERDTRQQRVRKAIDSLVRQEYLIQAAGLVGLADAYGEDGMEDDVSGLL